MYMIDSYEVYAASALTFCAVIMYVAAGDMIVVEISMYGNPATHGTVTISGMISAVALRILFVFQKYGPSIRRNSR
jgi:hypothetical protein